MLVKELLASHASPFPFIEGRKTVAEAVDIMSGEELTAVLIGSAQHPLGIFTSKDLLRCRRDFPGREISAIRINEAMTDKLVVAEPEDTVEQAMAMMISAGIRHLPVIEGRKVVCLLGLEDLVSAHVGSLTQELHYLKDYISDLQDAAHD